MTTALPFLGAMLSFALFPVFAPRLWLRQMGAVMAGWIVLLFALQWAAVGPAAAAHGLARAFLEAWLPFVVLLGAVYVVGGGVLVVGGPWGRPGGNVLLLAAGVLLAGVMGTLAASMVAIEPLLRANAHRRHRGPLVLATIILIGNAGGALSPLGNPPLLVGFLNGVPFFWPTLHLALPAGVFSALVLAGFYVLDRRLARFDPPPPSRRLRFRGLVNIPLLVVIVIASVVPSLIEERAVRISGIAVHPAQLAADAVVLGMGGLSWMLTPRAIRLRNRFSWEPIREVAILFAAIFATIPPVLALLEAGETGPFAPLLALAANPNGMPNPVAYFWIGGLLSAFLDNAPAYLVLFGMAGGEAARLVVPPATLLVAINMGTVLFGALTYTGSAPNLMLRAIASRRGVRMPGFFGYIALVAPALLPLYALIGIVFFR